MEANFPRTLLTCKPTDISFFQFILAFLQHVLYTLTIRGCKPGILNASIDKVQPTFNIQMLHQYGCGHYFHLLAEDCKVFQAGWHI